MQPSPWATQCCGCKQNKCPRTAVVKFPCPKDTHSCYPRPKGILHLMHWANVALELFTMSRDKMTETFGCTRRQECTVLNNACPRNSDTSTLNLQAAYSRHSAADTLPQPRGWTTAASCWHCCSPPMQLFSLTHLRHKHQVASVAAAAAAAAAASTAIQWGPAGASSSSCCSCCCSTATSGAASCC